MRDLGNILICTAAAANFALSFVTLWVLRAARKEFTTREACRGKHDLVNERLREQGRRIGALERA